MGSAKYDRTTIRIERNRVTMLVLNRTWALITDTLITRENFCRGVERNSRIISLFGKRTNKLILCQIPDGFMFQNFVIELCTPHGRNGSGFMVRCVSRMVPNGFDLHNPNKLC